MVVLAPMPILPPGVASGVRSMPMDCPDCKGATGQPYRAETIVGSTAIRVTMRCDQCHKEWVTDLHRKPDSDVRRS